MTVVSTWAGTNLPLCISSCRRYRTSANWYLYERWFVDSMLIQNISLLLTQFVQWLSAHNTLKTDVHDEQQGIGITHVSDNLTVLQQEVKSKLFSDKIYTNLLVNVLDQCMLQFQEKDYNIYMLILLLLVCNTVLYSIMTLHFKYHVTLSHSNTSL